MNSRSIVNKLNVFQSFVYSSIYKIIAVTETWLNLQILDNEILPTNFVIYRKDRDSRGGGVMLAVHESLQSKLIVSPFNLEVLSVEVSSGAAVITLCVAYIPPHKVAMFSDDLFILSLYLSKGTSLFLGILTSLISIGIVLWVSPHFPMTFVILSLIII